MKLAIKTEGNTRKVKFVDMSEEYGVALHSITISYRAMLKGLIAMPDKQMLAFSPGESAAIVRRNLQLQIDFCNDYVRLWQEAISKADPVENKPKLFN